MNVMPIVNKILDKTLDTDRKINIVVNIFCWTCFVIGIIPLLIAGIIWGISQKVKKMVRGEFDEETNTI